LATSVTQIQLMFGYSDKTGSQHLVFVYLISVVMMIAELHLIYFSYTCNNCFNVFVLIEIDCNQTNQR